MSSTRNQEEQEQIVNEVIDFVINGMWFIVDITDDLKYELDPTAPRSMEFSDLETPIKIETPSRYIDYTPMKCFDQKEKFEPLRFSQAAMKNCSRSEDPYLELVNEAIYGNPENQPKEGTPDYCKAAECFAIYGKGFLDVLKDPDYQKDPSDIRPPSKPLNPYAPNVLFPKENDLSTPLSLATYPNIGATTPNLLYPFQPASQYPVNFGQTPQNIKIQQMAKSLYKNAINTSALNAAQQILLQANQQTNYNHNVMSYPFYPALNQPLLYANPMLASSYFNAWVKETQINTAIFQQQHYNVYENNNMLIYAQMLQQTQKITQTVIAANKFQKQMGSNLAPGIANLNEGEASSSACFTDERLLSSDPSPTPQIKILTKGQKDAKPGK